MFRLNVAATTVIGRSFLRGSSTTASSCSCHFRNINEGPPTEISHIVRLHSSAAFPESPQLPPVLPPTLSSCPSSRKVVDAPQKTFLQRMYDRYSIKGQQHVIHTGEALFQAITRQASDPRWFGPGRIGRDFRPRHALVTMHLWFLHKRLISDEVDRNMALLIQEELFNILWDDTTCRIRHTGTSELLVNKYLLKVQQYTFMHLLMYDHAFTEFLDKPADRMNELRKIVWTHILLRDEEAEHRHDHLDRIAWYIEANYQNIVMEWPDQYYREGRLAWVDLPDFSNMRDSNGEIMPEHPIHSDDVLPEPWLRNITRLGKYYYWNPVTMRSTRERPT